MKDNPVAKNAHKFNKAAVHKDRKKALKKGDRKHKGRYEDSGNVEERSTLDVISSVLGRSKDRKKYDTALKAVKSGKYSVSKAAQMFGISPRALQDLVAEEKAVQEKNKGLWDNIHAKRKRGEKPAKPGDKNYPKTLDVESVQEGKEMHIRMDNFNGPEEKKVLDILRKHEEKGNITYTGETDKGIIFDIKKPAMLNGINRELKKASVSRAVLEGKNTLGEARMMSSGDYKTSSEKSGKGYRAKVVDGNGKEMYLGAAVYSTSKAAEGEADAYHHGYFRSGGGDKVARNQVMTYRQKNKMHMNEGKNTPGDGNPCWDTHKKVGTKMKNGKRVNDCVPKNEGRSAQDRLDARAAKLGIGKPNKAADDYQKMMMKKYGAKDMADLKKKMGMKEAMTVQQRSAVGKVSDVKRKEKTATTNAMKKAAHRAKVDQRVNEYKYQLDCRDHLEELTQRELDMMADRKKKNLVKRGKAKAEPKKSGAAGRTQNTGRSGGEDDGSLVMQLRKAQDLRGNYEIQFKGGKTKLPKQMIDKLLNTYDKLSKPADKKKFETLVTHELRKKEGIATQKSKTAADKAMDKFNKTQNKGLPAPRGKKSGPTGRELRDIERGK